MEMNPPVLGSNGGETGEEFAGRVARIVTGDGRTVRAIVESNGYPTEAARHIVEKLIPEWVDLFLRKNAGYGNMHGDLGIKAQYVDIHRKVGKLRRAWWHGQPIGPESAREVCMDLIGHLFLALELMDSDEVVDGE